MNREKELDDILKSLEKRRNEIDKDLEPILPPKSDEKQDDLLWIDSNDIKKKIESQNDDSTNSNSFMGDIEPPKVYKKEELQQETEVQKNNDKKKHTKIKFVLSKKGNELNKDAEDNNVEKIKKKKEPFVLTFPKLMAIVISILIVIAMCVAGVLYCYKNNLYMFEKDYSGFSYETDILSEYQNSYSLNNNFSGEIIIEDINYKSAVYNNKSDNAYFYDGADIVNKQQIRSINLTSDNSDIEKLYSTSDGYINASQKIEFNTLFEKKTYKVVAAYYTNKKAEDNLGYVFPYNINGTLTKQNFTSYRDGIKARSLYNTGYELMYTNDILNICIDSDTLMPDYKFVIVCVGVPKVDKNEVIVNTNSVYYPQSYYDKMNINNPFKNALGLNYFPVITLDENEQVTKKLSQNDYIED